MRICIVLAVVLLASPALHAETTLVFAGKPLVSAQDAGIDRSSAKLPPEKAKEFEVLITRDGEDFFWASRENKPLLRLDSQNFVTFVAIDGAGYIRIAKSHAVAMLKKQISGYPFTYVEHLTAGLTTYTYFGVEK